MQIHEPMTMLTDYLLGGWSAWLGWRLWRTGKSLGDRAVSSWSLVFLFSAVAAFAGGTAHGFSAQLGVLGHALVWKVTVQAVGIASLSFLVGTIVTAFRRRARRVLLILALVKWAVYAVWMSEHSDFRYVVYDYLPSLLFAGAVHGWLWLQRGKLSGRVIVAGIVVSLGAAGIQLLGLAPHPRFNHNDLYHVVQMGAFYLLYRGGLKLREAF